MNDKELLELAAKAAGYGHVWYLDGSDTPYIGRRYELGKPVAYQIFNPITEDGDALRLAVKLWIVPEVYKPECSVIAHIDAELFPYTTFSPREFLGDDPYAATRRAIVRAAAEIGKGMK